MARAYASASSQYFEIAAALAASPPFTFSGWAYAAAIGVSAQAIIAFGTSVTTVGRHVLFFGGTSFAPNNSIAAQSVSNDGATAGTALSASTYAASTWTHVAGVWASSTSRTGVINGVGGTADTTSVSPTGLDRTNLGCRWNTTRGNFLNGRLAEVGIWNVALNADELAALGAGYSPLMIRPSALIAYAPSFARATNEENWTGGNAFVPGASAPTAVDHPSRIIYPGKPGRFVSVAAGGGATPAAYMIGGGFGSGNTGGFYIGAD